MLVWSSVRMMCRCCSLPKTAGDDETVRPGREQLLHLGTSVWIARAAYNPKPSIRAQGYFYYIFGFCFIVGALTLLITIEVSVVCTYVQLCAEDYTWW